MSANNPARALLIGGPLHGVAVDLPESAVEFRFSHSTSKYGDGGHTDIYRREQIWLHLNRAAIRYTVFESIDVDTSDLRQEELASLIHKHGIPPEEIQPGLNF